MSIGYFAQDETSKLNPEMSVFETIDEVAVGEIRKKIRQILGSFLFSGDDAEKKVKVLSGGEKTRLALCKLLLEPYNFLILDEPTNHLDIVSKEILKDALESYSSTLIVVSHDRDFLEGLTDKVFYIKDKNIKVYHEGLKQFLKSYYTSVDEISTSKNKDNKIKSGKNTKKLANQLKSIERKINQLEGDFKLIQNQINSNDFQHIELEINVKKMNELKQEIEKKYEEWANVSSLIEA